MFFLIGRNKLKDMIKKFFLPQSYLSESLSAQLQKITKWIKHYKSNEKVEINVLLKVTLKQLSKIGSTNKNSDFEWLIIFKAMILIHELLSVGVIGIMFQQILYKIKRQIDKLSEKSHKKLIQITSHNQNKYNQARNKQQQKTNLFHVSVVEQKLLEPYFHYLTKRCQLLPKTFSQTHKCYYLINLLNNACCCNQVIYLFARYNFGSEFGIIAEFNIVLAQDVKHLYDLLRQYLGDRNGYNYPHEYTQQYDEQNLAVSQVDDLLLNLHQKLFHVFYNKYHFKKVASYVPTWIDLQYYLEKNNKKSLINKNQKTCDFKQPALDQTTTSLVDNKSGLFKNKQKSQIHVNLQTTIKNGITQQKLQLSLSIIQDIQRFLQNSQII